jgi:4-hydroxybenzoate polyprenyltransferase
MYSAPKIELKPFIMLRKIAVLKTTYLTLVWVFVTAVMPILISGAAWKYDMTLFVINRLFLIFPICVLFDYRDREEDRLEGIKNIATVITSRGLDIVFAVCVLINLSAAVFLLEEWHSLYYFACNIIPVILLVLTYRISKNTKSDLWVLRLA